MSYKAGDVVRIVPENVIRSFRPYVVGWMSPEGLYIDPAMLKMCGKEVTIKEQSIYEMPDGTFSYRIEEDNWLWPESCFDDGHSLADFSGLEELL